MRFIIIGDIHGCWMELLDLLKLVDPRDGDQVISIGDIIHKGPDEQESLRILQNCSHQYVLGNHEEKQLRWEKHEIRRQETDKPNPMKNVEDYNSFSPEDLAWLRNRARLYLQIRTEKQNYLLVHGGVEPRVKSLPKTNDPWKLSQREKAGFWSALRTRYVDSKGRMVSLGKETEEDQYWAEVYDGRFGHVVFGHQPFLSRTTPREYPHATAIDLGCVYGNVLCALIICGNTGDSWHVTVPAREKYAIHRKEQGSTNPVPE